MTAYRSGVSSIAVQFKVKNLMHTLALILTLSLPMLQTYDQDTRYFVMPTPKGYEVSILSYSTKPCMTLLTEIALNHADSYKQTVIVDERKAITSVIKDIGNGKPRCDGYIPVRFKQPWEKL